MLINQVNVDLLRVPLPRPRALPRSDDANLGVPVPEAIIVLLVQLGTDAGLTGWGEAVSDTES